MSARWVFLPVLGAPLAHAPVLRFNLWPRLARPIDGGRTFRGRRLLGENKTWRGAAVMFAGVMIATIALQRSRRYRVRLPSELQDASPVVTGSLLAASVVVGELPNSFLKRQLDIAPGDQRGSPAGIALSMFDQADFVLATWLLLRPAFKMTAGQALDAAAVVTIVHLPLNVLGYLIGARTSPI
jgi:CDP-2,3-bis-(O-geranylgeranyl)-sn-glycerol synthase